MRKITIWILATVTAVTLMFAYRTSWGDEDALASGTDPQADRNANSADGGTGSDGGAAAPAGGASAASGGASTANNDGSATFNGSAVKTRWGTVQVQIVVSGGKITSAKAIQTPNENPKDIAINDYAVPVLNKAVLAAQSAKIDSVSGATVTSDGYRRSLQSAIDSARLGK